MLNQENSEIIEKAYQDFIKLRKEQETYIQDNDDIFQIKFNA